MVDVFGQTPERLFNHFVLTQQIVGQEAVFKVFGERKHRFVQVVGDILDFDMNSISNFRFTKIHIHILRIHLEVQEFGKTLIIKQGQTFVHIAELLFRSV